jgi:hypothetical protein
VRQPGLESGANSQRLHGIDNTSHGIYNTHMNQTAIRQASTPEGLYRWFVYTNHGRKIAWAPSAADAKAKAEKNKHKVRDVEPAPSLLDAGTR